LLDLFERALVDAAARPLPERAHTAFAQARARFPAQAAAMLPPDDDLGGPGASLLVAASDGAQLWLEWLGEQAARLVRDGQTVARAAPHTLRELARDQPEARGADIPGVLVRLLAAHQPDAHSDRLAAAVRPGDLLVLTSHEPADPTTIDGRAAAQAIADQLVARAFAVVREPAYALAVVLRWT